MVLVLRSWLWRVLTSRPPPHESGALPLSYRAIIMIIDFGLKELLCFNSFI